MKNDELEALNEIVNIGIGRSAYSLNLLIHSHIELSVPITKVVTREDFRKELRSSNEDRQMSSVRINFDGSMAGSATLLFKESDANKIVDTLLIDEEFKSNEMDSLKIGVLTEVGNIVLNGLLSVIGNSFNQHFNFHVPTFDTCLSEELFINNTKNIEDSFLLNKVQFNIEELDVRGEIILLFQVGSLDMLVNALHGYIEETFNETA